MQRVILIHGNAGGTGSDAWFPYVVQELEKLGLRCEAPDFPEPEIAPAKVWLPCLEDLGADADTVLIGWSTGAIAAMRYAETHKICGSVLVGGYYTDLGDETEKASGYFDKPWDWEAIKRNQQWIMQFTSIDDPYITIQESRLLHEYLHTENHEFANAGHFDQGKYMTEFPELVAELQRKLGL